MKWNKTTDGLPQQVDENNDVSCLVIRSGQIEILCWNHYHVCWDGADGDDYECDPGDVEYWMPLSDLPKPS